VLFVVDTIVDVTACVTTVECGRPVVDVVVLVTPAAVMLNLVVVEDRRISDDVKLELGRHVVVASVEVSDVVSDVELSSQDIDTASFGVQSCTPQSLCGQSTSNVSLPVHWTPSNQVRMPHPGLYCL
jgi:hypothetical protein